ncbi:protein-tyrosine phosphatase-like protein, partial [Umbelopsis sp. PMI_123]
YKHGPICILPYLYLGDESNANDIDRLKYLHIGYILNVAKEVTHPSEHDFSMTDISEDDGGVSSPSLSISSSASSTSSINTLNGTQLQQIKYKKFAWTHNHENLATELGPALEVIDRARAAKRAILVHCQCGVARSASLVIAYVMHTFKISLDQAYDFVKAKSSSISPNMYLMFQLRDFE